MRESDKAFQERLLATFRVEAEEHLQALSSGLLELERSPAGESRGKVLETVFREAHSLKGAARAVGLSSIEQVCHAAENVFSAVQRGELELSAAMLGVLHDTVDSLAPVLRAADEAGSAKAGVDVSRLLARMNALLGAQRAAAAQSETPPALEPAEKSVAPATVRISTAKLDALLLQAEELLSAKLGSAQHAADLRDAARALAAWKKTRRGSAAGVRALQRMLARAGNKNGFLDSRVRRLPELLEREEELVKSFDASLAALVRSAERMQRALGAMVDALLEDVKQARMLPAASALAVFPKFVRDLCREQGKEAELIVEGADIELDRRILEELRDPLMHLLRNCIDHGIEGPQERSAKGKAARGTIRVAFTRKSEATIEIVVADDGAGIDAHKLAGAALKLGVISQRQLEALDAGMLLPLVFRSGVSTSPVITDLSGRGLGLAIVREKVERLGGSAAVEAQRDQGTTFRLVVPLTFATFRGVHVRVAGRRFVLPTTYVQQVLKVKRSAIKTVKNRETVEWQGEAVAAAQLAHVLGFAGAPPPASSTANVQLVIAGTPDRKIAFAVDEVLEEREVLVKSLGRQLARVRNVAGASVLGSGELVPILDVPDLLQAAAKSPAGPASKEQATPQRKAVLVAEDSITSRTLLKTILEATGYEVATAADGADAFALLKKQRFDAVVSDVDMPRMSGFELTAKIRGDSALSALPVVLVTSLESREHREKGIDVGASAYIVKSSFDQSNLLGTLARLL